jgi:hypothetical protein
MRTKREQYRRVVKAVSSSMADITYFVALPFVAADDGVAPGEPVECLSASAAILRAEYLSRREGVVGSIAFSRSGDLSSGTFDDAQVLKKFGDAPDDMSGL